MRIVFDASTLEQRDNASRSITGVLYFDFSGFHFPSEQWNDFAVVIITWWLSAIQKLERDIEREVVLRFMDGPYYLRLAREDDATALLRCIEDRGPAGMVHEEYVNVADMGAQLRRVARHIASACSRNGMESSELDALKRYLPN